MAVFNRERTRGEAGRSGAASSFRRETILSHVVAIHAQGRRRAPFLFGPRASWVRPSVRDAPMRRLVRAAFDAYAYVDAWARRGLASLFGAKSEEEGAPGPEGDGRGTPDHAAEARPEGYLVSRVAGEDALREAPIPLTEDRLAPPEPALEPPPPRQDQPFRELPWAYEDDAFVALPRDPATMWLYWDFSPQTLARAREGLTDPRVRLRILEGANVVRELDLALESRSFYVNDLPAGRVYRGELVFVAHDGEKLIGHPSNTVHLPPVGPSPVVDDRFATIPWGLPLGPDLDLFAHGAPGPGISNLERQALRSASNPDLRLGASERAARGGGSWSAKLVPPHGAPTPRGED